MSVVWVFVGGGLGSVARYATGRLVPLADLTAGDFPWATLVANLLACGLLGIGLALSVREVLGRDAQLLLLTGFCGGFSTFSTYVLEVFRLAEDGYWGVAALYFLVSTLGGLLAFGLLYWLTR